MHDALYGYGPGLETILCNCKSNTPIGVQAWMGRYTPLTGESGMLLRVMTLYLWIPIVTTNIV